MTEATKTWEAFRLALGARESGGNYAVVNKLGFLGRYQFGLARLCDFGLTERIPGTSGNGNASFRWILPFSRTTFLADHDLQEYCFELHVGDLARTVQRRFPNLVAGMRTATTAKHGDVLVTLSGAVGVCHLLGPGGLGALLAGDDRADAFGTHASDYLVLFGGYTLPAALITPAEFGQLYAVRPTLVSA